MNHTTNYDTATRAALKALRELVDDCNRFMIELETGIDYCTAEELSTRELRASLRELVYCASAITTRTQLVDIPTSTQRGKA